MMLTAKTYLDFQLDPDVTSFWKSHQWHPYADMDYLRHEYESAVEPWRSCVIVIRDEAKVLACAIGKIQSMPIRLQFGYKVFNGPPLVTLVLHRSGFVGNWDDATLQILMQELHKLLTSRMIDALLLRMISLDSPLHSISLSMAPFFRRDHFPIIQEYWTTTRLDSFESFLSAHPNIKKNLNRYVHRIDRVLGDRVRIKCYRDPKEMQLMLEHSEEVGGKTWQRKLGAPSFLTDDEQSRHAFHFQKGWARAYVLYLDGKPAAFKHGIVYQGVFYVGSMGYDPAYQNLRIGTYLRMNVIRDQCADPKIHTMDYSVGNTEAKRQYCDTFFRVSDIHLFGPGIGLSIHNSLRLLVQGGHQLAKHLFHQSGWYQAIRQRWRRGA